jgi:hypothetical protein
VKLNVNGDKDKKLRVFGGLKCERISVLKGGV